MSANMPPIRRIVTGHNAQGRSIFLEDGVSPAQKTVPERPGYRVTNLWRTGAGDNVNTPDSIATHQGVLPPAGGTVVRIIEWPAEPEDPSACVQCWGAKGCSASSSSAPAATCAARKAAWVSRPSLS